MRRILLTCILLACAVFPALLSAAFSGSWRATAKVNESTIVGVYLTLTSGPSGVTGTATINPGTSQAIENVVVNQTHITFSTTDAGATTYFDLNDAGDGTLVGTVRLSSGPLLDVKLEPLGR